MSKIVFLIAALLAVLPVTGCEDLGSLGDPGGYGTPTSDMVGEVQFVDTGRRQIEVRTDAGRVRNVDYDDQTQVIYRQRNYQVGNLERGDYIALQTRQDSQGRLYADTITVRESVQDRGYRGTAESLRGTVVRDDSRHQALLIETDDRRQVNVYYDRETRFRYRNTDYSLAAIEPGDQLVIRVRPNAANSPTADLITVTSKAQDVGTNGVSRLDRVEGTVESIDARRGQFEVRDRSDHRVTVSVLYDPPRSVADRFSRLRTGDYVRLEGHYLNQDRFELDKFM